MAITVETFLTAGTSTWTCPTGVTSVQVECYGGGGAGCGVKNAIDGGAGGGGAGGQYAKKQVTVVPGTDYTLVVGAGAAGSNIGGLTGGDSKFATTTVIAKGGVGAAISSFGAGSTTGGVGDTVRAGGSGAIAGGGYSGAGGGGAGSTSAGANGVNPTGGAGGGGQAGSGGGSRSTGTIAGRPGNQAGGAGGGAWVDITGSAAGGDGGDGAVVLTYTIVLATSKHHFILAGQ